MPITIKSEREIALMRHAGHVLAHVHNELAREIHEGMNTWEIDMLTREIIQSYEGCTPNFLNYEGFPAAVCVSINHEIVHGIPSEDRVLMEGDIVSLDTGVCYKGYQSDAARTHAIGEVSREARKLIDVTRTSFFEGVKAVRPGIRLQEIGRGIQTYVESEGFYVTEDLCGHGIGRNLHEEPDVLNYVSKCRGIRLEKGMTIAIEPMISAGTSQIWWEDNDWTAVTLDGSLSAHYENTVYVTEDGYEILTLV